MADDRTLPGWPTKKLIKRVRSQLWHYGIRPVRQDLWRTTWIWADAIARSYWQTHWPLASEIAAQYVVLLVAELNDRHALKLAYRADTVVPPEVAAKLPNTFDPRALIAFGLRKRRSPRLRRSKSDNAVAGQDGVREGAVLLGGQSRLPFASDTQPISPKGTH